ncbi:hypothetical protein B0H14DRAFT_3455360 [Mycena olivaceomarginata]|nr:hypothetical protein B0H14DRAFT_3455360 [Mycena olivaceomarginata]
MSGPITIAILGATGHPWALPSSGHRRPTQSAENAHTLAARYPTLYLTVHAVDYTGAKAETGLADVAHLCLLPGFIAQDAVACAAKAAGVKLFVPSEFGAPTHSMALNSESYIVGKIYHHDFSAQTGAALYAGLCGHMFPKSNPPRHPLPQLSPEDPIPLGQPPFETSRYHVAAYIVQLLLDRGVEARRGRGFM